MTTEEIYATVLKNPPTGWCSKEKAIKLIDYILTTKPTRVVEIGTWGGSSAIPMALALKENGRGVLTCIDAWDSLVCLEGILNKENKDWWSNQQQIKAVYDGFKLSVEAFRVTSQVEVIKATSDAAVGLVDSIDLLHIDGNHSADPCIRDTKNYIPKVKAGGLICFDDYEWQEGGEFTVKPAVELAKRMGCELLEISCGCAWLRKK